MSCLRITGTVFVAAAVLLLTARQAAAGELAFVPPQYDLDIQLDIDQHTAHVHQVVTWVNYHCRPAAELVFNVHSHYKIPDNQVALFAKTLELLRMTPSESLDFEGHCCDVEKVTLVQPGRPGPAAGVEIQPHYLPDNDTALVVPLPAPVGPGEAVTLLIDFTFHLPQKQGRWGQWCGVTFLSNWLPVLAFYDDHGWQPTPFVAWHQPFFNEAGIYTARVTLPADQKIACTGSIVSCKDVGDHLKQVEIGPVEGRDFAFLCSARYCEYTGEAGPVRIRVMAFAEHEYYAREMVRIISEAIPVYSRWFGPYPYPEFTIAESYFGWNGNECTGLVMIDERIFALPHLADGFVDYLVSHETCHQWWYNVVGTNGYAETWMDEGLATYFSHRLMDIKHGKHNSMVALPRGFEWLPDIDRQTYRYYGLTGTIGRGEHTATVPKDGMPGFGHLVTLLSMCYDRGSKIVGMIEDRMGEAAFFDFLHLVYSRYHFRVLRVRDFEHELTAYTGQDWKEFFDHWLFAADMTDWCVEKVDLQPVAPHYQEAKRCHWWPGKAETGPCHATILLRQKAQYNEQTVLGFCFDEDKGYRLRLPILPNVERMQLDDPPAVIQMLPENRVRVEVDLPCAPVQIAVDPDQVLVDCEPANNYWKTPIRWRLTPLYTQVDETDLTTAYDRWNVTIGPWLYGAAYDDPWYTRSAMVGLRAGVYRTQQFDGGVYTAYRTDDRDIVAGVDGLWDHWPFCHTQVGFNAERSLIRTDGDYAYDRASVFGRYVFKYGSSLYLPPMEYLEAFTAVQDHNLPPLRCPVPGADPFDHTTEVGLHYHRDYMTPYWDPEAGYRIDATYASGFPIFGEHEAFNQVNAQLAAVKYLPDWLGSWLSDTRVAARLYGAAGLPNRGEFFALGGGELFRGFDPEERQGSMVWVASLEWRVPLAKGLTWDTCDHIAGLRGIYAAAFYDAGQAFLNGHSVCGVAQAAGGGLRLDVAWFSLVERTILRVDVAKTINVPTPVQVWFGIQHPF